MTDLNTVTVQERLRAGEWWHSIVQGPNPTSFTTDETDTAREAADLLDRCKEALTAVRAYYFLANPTDLDEAMVCDLVCGVLTQLNGGRNVG